MRVNLPVTQKEFRFADNLLIVSTTDAQGRITHCNQAFVEISGYAYDELIGQPHNLIRHPDMPAEGFKDLWATVGRGRPWTGIVKNRRADGDHYWVKANVTPITEGGRPVAYMSVRHAPTRDEIQAAEALYARLAAERGNPSFRLHAGRVMGQVCNRFSGSFALTTEGITFGPVVASKMACAAPLMQTEQALFAALSHTTRFDIADDGALVLLADDIPLLTARR